MDMLDVIVQSSERHYRSGGRVYSQFGANFNSRFSSREAAKNAKENGFYGFSAPSLKENSSAMELRPLCVLRGFT